MSKLKTKTEYFVWTDDKVELFLKVTIDYKVKKTSWNVDKESCQTKYSSILHMFTAQYLSPEEIISTIALHVLLASQYIHSRFLQSRTFPAIFFRAGRLDPILIRHPRKVPLPAVHKETRKRRFQKSPLWRAFSVTVFIGNVGRNPYRNETFAFSNENGYVYTFTHSVRFKWVNRDTVSCSSSRFGGEF